MKVSIVTISYNQARFLEKAIMSVLDQDYHDVEYIVVDPGSTDGSRDIIDRYRSRLTHVLFETDAGPADGLNKGFKLGTGDIYGFINSDDYLLPGTISHIVDFFERHPNIDVVSGHGYYVDEHERILRGVYSHRIAQKSFAYGSVVLLQQSTFFRRQTFEQVGGFNVQNPISWDGELWADMLKNKAKFARIHKYLSAFRIYRTSLTGSQINRQIFDREMKRIQMKMGIKKPNLFLGRMYWFMNRITDPVLLRMQIINGLQYGFSSPIPKQE